MFFVVSKMAWLLLAPSHLIFECLAAAVLLWAFGLRRAGQIAGLAASALYLALGVLPLGSWLAAPLENRFARGPWPTHVDGILTLGGGLNTAVLMSRGAPASQVVGRPGRDLPTHALRRQHGPGHVHGRGREQPDLTWVRPDQLAGIGQVLQGVAGTVLEHQSARIQPHLAEDVPRGDGVGVPPPSP